MNCCTVLVVHFLRLYCQLLLCRGIELPTPYGSIDIFEYVR